MSKPVLVLVCAAFMALTATAQFRPYGTASGAVDTVAAAREAPDETQVTLSGRIIQRIAAETYLFEDQTGQIRLDIGDEIWGGVEVSPETPVRIRGETDRGIGGMDIWVHLVERSEGLDQVK